MHVYDDITQLVGNTPMVRLNRVVGNIDSTIYIKLEYYNPSCSVKDRAAISMINQAEKDGLLKQGSTIVEGTSGNTGIALATIAAAVNIGL